MFKKIDKVMSTTITWGSYFKASMYAMAIGYAATAVWYVAACTDVPNKIKSKFTKHEEENVFEDEDDFM